MRNLRGTYVHRGDMARRRRRIVRLLYGLGVSLAMWLVASNRRPAAETAEAAVAPASESFFSIGGGEARSLRQELETTKGELDLVRAQYERADRIIKFSTRFGVTANMAASVLDAALAEGIDPELGFRLVQLESEFQPHATSKVGAVGLTQVMPSTARLFDRSLSRDRLYDPKVNLRVGFHYLRTLIHLYHGNAKLALTAYNRGEDAVKLDMDQGRNPSNGYEQHVMKGYRGKGTVN